MRKSNLIALRIIHECTQGIRQPVEQLKDMSPAAVFICGYDPLCSAGVEFEQKSQQAGNYVSWYHFDDFLQLAPRSEDATKATQDVAKHLRRIACGE